MKSTIVPAQITTVEDKIAGSLSLSQLLLLAAPAFIGTAMYILMPPMGKMSLYKIIVVAIVAFAFGLLAIRVKGKILLLWVMILLRYNLRPRYHIFDKNDPHLRESNLVITEEVTAPVVADEPTGESLPALSVAEAVQLENLIANPKASVQFLTDKKGALRVHFDEVK
ncbi:MAG: PrgI family mobile element protein [Candidatus Saccharimonadales bacterium]